MGLGKRRNEGQSTKHPPELAKTPKTSAPPGVEQPLGDPGVWGEGNPRGDDALRGQSGVKGGAGRRGHGDKLISVDITCGCRCKSEDKLVAVDATWLET